MKKEKREKLIDALSLHIIDGMDWKTMEQYVYEQLSSYYDGLVDTELESEALDYFGVDSIDEIV